MALATTTLVNAALNIIPSMAMLMTAVRSHQMPLSAPKAMGVARSTVLASIPVRLKDLPAVAHTRKAITKRTSSTASRACGSRKPRESWYPPMNAAMKPRMSTVSRAGTTRSGTLGTFTAVTVFRPKVALMPGSMCGRNSHQMAMANRRYTMPSTRSRRR